MNFEGSKSGDKGVMRDLSKYLRGGDFRNAVKAVAELRHVDFATGRALIPSLDPVDEQRAFQLLIARLVVEGGVRGLAARWGELPSPAFRERLVSEIGQALDLWADEGTIELFMAALEDPEPSVERNAVVALVTCLRELTHKERKAMAKTLRGKAAIDALDQTRSWMTPVRCARVAKAVTAALDRCAGNPKLLTWPDKYIELLGLSARNADQHVIALLEGFRPIAGETRRYETETLDPENLPWSTQVVAEGKGIAPGTQFKRVWSKPTGLLDLKGLEKAIERIRLRAK